MIKRRRMLALILVAVMALSLMACGGSTGASTSAGAGGTTETAAVAEDGETPLVVGYSPFNSKFSPFFSQTAYDQDAMAMTQLYALAADMAKNAMSSDSEDAKDIVEIIEAGLDKIKEGCQEKHCSVKMDEAKTKYIISPPKRD